MSDQMSNETSMYQLGIWVAEPAKKEFYSPGAIFIKAKEDELFKVPRFLGEGNIPERENLLKLIDIVSQAIINALELERENGRVYLVCLCEGPKLGLHFRLFPRYKSDKGFLDELDDEIKHTNDGLALMARWRKQFLLKKDPANKKLRKAHDEAIQRVREALDKRALTQQDCECR